MSLCKVQVKYAGLCGSDINKLRIEPNLSVYSLGHEIVGVITEISKTKDFDIGDAVIVDPFICINCNECTVDSVNHCAKTVRLGKEIQGAFSGEILVPTTNLYKISKVKQEGVLADSVAVIFHAFNAIDVNLFHNCLIIGDGTLAILSAIILKEKKEDIKITILAKNANKLKDKVNFCTVESYPYNESNSFDLVIETVGGNQVNSLNTAIMASKNNGTMLVLGSFGRDIAEAIEYRELFFKQIRIIGINSFGRITEDFKRAVNWVTQNYDKISFVITHTYAFDDLKKITEILSISDKIKVVFEK